MPDISIVSDTKLKVSGTIALHLRKGESRPRVNLGVVNKPGLAVPRATTCTDRFIKLIRPAERKIVPNHSQRVSILMVHDAKS